MIIIIRNKSHLAQVVNEHARSKKIVNKKTETNGNNIARKAKRTTVKAGKQLSEIRQLAIQRKAIVKQMKAMKANRKTCKLANAKVDTRKAKTMNKALTQFAKLQTTLAK